MGPWPIASRRESGHGPIVLLGWEYGIVSFDVDCSTFCLREMRAIQFLVVFCVMNTRVLIVMNVTCFGWLDASDFYFWMVVVSR